MSADLIAEKHAQAKRLIAESPFDAWLVFDRETTLAGDPVLPFLIDGGLTWQSALVFTENESVAVVGNYDADPLKKAGHFDKVVPYVRDVREPMLEELERVCGNAPKLGINYSPNDVMADGLSHGMHVNLERYLSGTRFQGTLVSAESMVRRLRGCKVPAEIDRIRKAIGETVRIFGEVENEITASTSELDIYQAIQAKMDDRRLGYAWDRAGDPIVNSGPNSMIGHGRPSADITPEPGHVFHIDLGVIRDGYSSDIQRCWYVPTSGETVPPDEVLRAFEGVSNAIKTGFATLRAGVTGREVDQAARESITKAGFEEYQHAFGHQVGRMAHDGGTVLGPAWERYGESTSWELLPGEVYTLELGVIVPGGGYLGLEEMALVTEGDPEWLTSPLEELPLLPLDR